MTERAPPNLLVAVCCCLFVTGKCNNLSCRVTLWFPVSLCASFGLCSSPLRSCDLLGVCCEPVITTLLLVERARRPSSVLNSKRGARFQHRKAENLTSGFGATVRGRQRRQNRSAGWRRSEETNFEDLQQTSQDSRQAISTDPSTLAEGVYIEDCPSNSRSWYGV